ncbi:MAG: IS21-like element helper ATPase IstB [Acidobacteriota bacterium]|nr:IS21-like element helper ATPase IstB [Acidobacteriota bacterium]
MNSRTTTPMPDLADQLARIGLHATAENLEDTIARATKSRWSPRILLEEIARSEMQEKSRRGSERRLQMARLGRFKMMADFDWNWPKKIDRDAIERALTLDFIDEKRNLVMLGSNGLGKTMIAKNIAFKAAHAGHTVLFRTAAELIEDLQVDSPELRRRRLTKYSRPALLCIDEVGYLSYDHHAADLLYEVVNRRYEQKSIVVTTNRTFKDWNLVFPNATCIATLLDRLTHHADVTIIEGRSFRVRESEQEAAARRRKRRPCKKKS